MMIDSGKTMKEEKGSGIMDSCFRFFSIFLPNIIANYTHGSKFLKFLFFCVNLFNFILKFRYSYTFH